MEDIQPRPTSTIDASALPIQFFRFFNLVPQPEKKTTLWKCTPRKFLLAGSAVRRANQDLEQFAFSATHDLQEPLRSVKIYSELLATRHADTIDEEARKFIAFVRSGATRMELLVRDLLAYTQVAKFDAPSETADANEALKDALANLAGAISEYGAKISADPLPSLPVHGMHLQQAFQNLVGNAIKYRSPDRQPLVYVGVERQDGYWLFAVNDNGIGIDPEYKEDIFGLFTRLHTSDEYSGTGIGLAICQRIVDRYHGRIWVESEPGCGSIFRFKLPAWRTGGPRLGPCTRRGR
ncbi:MAG TPA: ATP-binding protein [Bryobacteraceae bacterium]|nr:ATP-binding protein [Bryobacteraceae bacterium]